MTTTGYGISGIGYPTSALGTYGLTPSGSYGSYDNYMPSMMGMNGSIFGASPMNAMMNPMMNPMMAMYNPTYMTQTQQQIEASQLAHANNMHAGVLGNEVAAHRRSDSALIQKALTNSDIKQGVRNLHEQVIKGDQKGIREEFDKLKAYICNTYADEIAARSDKLNPSTSAAELIEIAYSRIISAQRGGKIANLYDDILEHGETSFENGFMQGFRRGHQGQYVDETINHCFGLRIDEKEHKDFAQKIGRVAGGGASILEKGAMGLGVGAALGASAYTFGGGAVSLGGKALGLCKSMKFNLKTLGKWAIIPATVLAIGSAAYETIKQFSKPKTA